MSAQQVELYLKRAEDFLLGMQLLRDEVTLRNSSALLGIHAAVSYTDALRVGLGDETFAADDHLFAVQALRRLLSNKGVEMNKGALHLEGLISKKSDVAYGSRRLEPNAYERIYTRAERYAHWANGVGRELGIEGWRDDAY